MTAHETIIAATWVTLWAFSRTLAWYATARHEDTTGAWTRAFQYGCITLGMVIGLVGAAWPV